MSLSIKPNVGDYQQSLYQAVDDGKGKQDVSQVDGSTLNLCNETSEADSKHNLAKKQAMKLISDAYDRMKQRETAQEELTEAKRTKVADYQDLKSKLHDIDAQKEALKQEYGIEEDSKEQEDLVLLEKYQDNKFGPMSDRFTKEEIVRLKELQDTPLTEYQKRALEINAAKDQVVSEMNDKKSELVYLTQEITNGKLSMLKSHDLEDALNGAEKIMDEAGEEILGLLFTEGKEHIEEKAKDEQEKAKEAAEKRKEQDERIEKIKEEKQEQEELIALDHSAQLLKADSNSQKIADSKVMEAQKEIQKIMDENHMINEDLKGIEIDLNF